MSDHRSDELFSALFGDRSWVLSMVASCLWSFGLVGWTTSCSFQCWFSPDAVFDPNLVLPPCLDTVFLFMGVVGNGSNVPVFLSLSVSLVCLNVEIKFWYYVASLVVASDNQAS